MKKNAINARRNSEFFIRTSNFELFTILPVELLARSAFGVRCLGTAFQGGGKPPHSEGLPPHV
jgi:hypothetical protein